MEIFPVTDAATASLFLKVPLVIYKNDPNWIRPLDKDINDVFDKSKNKAFRFGKLQRWILKDNEGNLAGRIAAFVNTKYKNKGDEFKVGGIGFFECQNDMAAAELLLLEVFPHLKQNYILLVVRVETKIKTLRDTFS